MPNSPVNNSWWRAQSGSAQYQPSYGLSYHDGLPRSCSPRQAQPVYNEMWNSGTTSGSSWGSTQQQSQPSSSITSVSPTAIHLGVPAMSMSTSSESSHGGMLCMSESDSYQSSNEDNVDLSAPEVLFVVEEVPARHDREMLHTYSLGRVPPAKLSHDSDYEPRRSSKKSSSKHKSKSHRRARPSTPLSNPPVSREAYQSPEPAPQRPVFKLISPKPEQSPGGDMTDAAKHYRSAKDNFLVQSKLAGMSYKDIRIQGGYTEAESTLRGRFRTLTKPKTARVRKPEWDENDVSNP